MLSVPVTALAPPEQLVLASAVGDANPATTLQLQQRRAQLIQIQPCIQACCALQCSPLELSKRPPALPAALLLCCPAEERHSERCPEHH